MSNVRCLFKKTFLSVFALAVSSFSVHARDLVIAMPNWPSGQATANILKVGLKKEFGIDTEVRELGSMIAFAGLNSGDVDIHPEIWSPNLDSLVDKYVTKARTVSMSPVGVQAWQGLCETRVTAEKYDIRDISDLNDPKKTVVLDTDGDGQGELWIGAETWASTAIERIRANSYGYAKTMALLETPEDVAMAAVDAAEATDRPIVFACYAPHYIFKLHDIVRLTEPPYDPGKWKIVLPSEDPQWLVKSSAAVGWNAAHFRVGYATSLRQSHPEVVKFLERIDFKENEITEMSYALQVERQAPFDFATKWVAAHAERVHGWASK
ncbi:glycine betaine ABC transporter substrate-binding protein [Mesorhizobium sp. B1-1-8]|uniref:ABC transporter substrate-binding protein n=1 Tax=Mesorhizobium sp. B1-1-8 TaxID=2589976 RepID=UPI001128AB36|nr:glycine betaine ABC transporter substrate-binding protein [Mesorhizobium sp. B1-1-8]UCI05660.1 amino acid-binding protein [Mesorhizobium sp. B1-1-8]